MRANADLGAAELARLLDRTQRSVEGAAHRNRISLRRRGERRGTVLCQPRGASLRGELRETLLRDSTLIAERMRIDRDAELCPSCGKRPVRVQRAGFCGVCHMERLTECHLERQAEHDAQKRLWAERQRLHRARQETPA